VTAAAHRRVIRVHAPGGYDRLSLESEPMPEPGPGEVRVATRGVGVNYADCAVRWGVYKSARELVGWPIVPGFEFAGEVDAVGPGVPEHQPGDPVFGVRLFGSYASHVVAPAHQVFPQPEGWSAPEAAAFPVAFLTAYYALFQCVRIRRDATVLVHSAAGGVGTALLQLARIQGWRVVGVVGGDHKAETARRFGADEVIVRSREDLWAAARKHAPGGYDAILDASGPATLSQSYEHLAPTGKLVVYGFHTMLPRSSKHGRGRINWARVAWERIRLPRLSPFHMTSENRTVAGFNLSFVGDRADLLEDSMGALLPWINRGEIQPPHVTPYLFADVSKAHRAIESAQTTGKLVLIP